MNRKMIGGDGATIRSQKEGCIGSKRIISYDMIRRGKLFKLETDGQGFSLAGGERTHRIGYRRKINSDSDL